jgi:hypothetical protein
MQQADESRADSFEFVGGQGPEFPLKTRTGGEEGLGYG